MQPEDILILAFLSIFVIVGGSLFGANTRRLAAGDHDKLADMLAPLMFVGLPLFIAFTSGAVSTAVILIVLTVASASASGFFGPQIRLTMKDPLSQLIFSGTTSILIGALFINLALTNDLEGTMGLLGGGIMLGGLFTLGVVVWKTRT